MATFRLYAELGDALRPRPSGRIEVDVPAGTTVGRAIEHLGLRPAEVDLVLVDGRPAGMDQPIGPASDVALYPVFEALDVGPVSPLPGRPLRRPRFAADVHLGKLARRLRLLGFDTWWRSDAEDAALAALLAAEGRIVLSRDHGLLARKAVTHGILVHSTDPDLQVREVLDRLDLRALARPFTRCTACNGEIEAAGPEAVAGRFEPAPREVWRCTGCGAVYWKGRPWAGLQRIVARALENAGSSHDSP
jgi:uncharacterized protein